MAPHAESTFLTPEQSPDRAAINGRRRPKSQINDMGVENGSAGRSQLKSHLTRPEDDEELDLICVGFGPASLAMAIALHDALDSCEPLPFLHNIRNRKPRVLFLERQSHFAWHEGMLLPGAKMQISFMKDLATLRDPRSRFTFINYLFEKQRLVQFTNLDTFLPQRIEYADYMRWCADHFSDVVDYSQDVASISPITSTKGAISQFTVESRHIATGTTTKHTARHVVVAIGGRPTIPAHLPQNDARIIHSSAYARSIDKILPDPFGAYNVAVLGSGQSAAEIFENLQSRYPNSRTRLIIRGSALKPSDDSPFVNEIFDPTAVDTFHARDPAARATAIAEHRATNYGVVRPALLEHLYAALYTQRIREPDETRWQHRILRHREVVRAAGSPAHEARAAKPGGRGKLTLTLRDTNASTNSGVGSVDGRETDSDSTLSMDVEAETDPEIDPAHHQQELHHATDIDAVIVAAGYARDAHETLLAPAQHLLPASSRGRFEVARDYRVKFDEGAVAPWSGVWLQGCNEGTHGLSDTLLSILAVRGGEMVRNIFGD